MLYNSPVVFNQEHHTYLLDGVYLDGVTKILGATIFKDKYAGIPKEIMDAAAAKGIYVHECCELMDSLGVVTECEEANAYAKLKEENNLVPIANEYLISDELNVASSVDVVFEDYSLGDFKTTSKLDEDYLSWQLSIYAYLFEKQNKDLKVPHLYAIWLRGSKATIKEVSRITEDKVEELLDSYFNGAKLPETEKSEVPAVVKDAEQTIINIYTQLKDLESKKKELESGLLLEMEKADVKKWSTDRISLTRVLPSTSESFDSKKLKEDNPELYSKYIKTVNKKSFIKIAVI